MVIGQRRVKLFRDGRSQAVYVPREFELPGDDAIMRKEGEKLIIEAAPLRSLLVLLRGLSAIEEDLPAIHDEAPGDVNL